MFPGQGAQSVGMGRELADRYAVARDVFDEVDECLGFGLSRLCFEGPAETLELTEWAQPAILACSVAAYRALAAEVPLTPAAVAGHSLGEWSALVVAGALTVVGAARAVRERGRLMQAAVPVGEGGMVAIMGLPTADVEVLCNEGRGHGVLEPANLNGAGQVVVAGHTDALDRIMVLAKRAGGRARRLPVSAPFHCSLMQSAAEGLRPVLDRLEVCEPALPVVSSVEPRPVRDADDARDLLGRQLTAPVRWEETVQSLLAARPDGVLECGPGQALSGLIRRIEPTLRLLAVGTPDGVESARELCR